MRVLGAFLLLSLTVSACTDVVAPVHEADDPPALAFSDVPSGYTLSGGFETQGPLFLSEISANGGAKSSMIGENASAYGCLLVARTGAIATPKPPYRYRSIWLHYPDAVVAGARSEKALTFRYFHRDPTTQHRLRVAVCRVPQSEEAVTLLGDLLGISDDIAAARAASVDTTDGQVTISGGASKSMPLYGVLDGDFEVNGYRCPEGYNWKDYDFDVCINATTGYDLSLPEMVVRVEDPSGPGGGDGPGEWPDPWPDPGDDDEPSDCLSDSYDGICIPSGPGGGLPSPLTEEERLEALLEEDPFALIDIECAALAEWQDVATNQVPASVISKLEGLEADRSFWTQWMGDWEVQELSEASGAVVNMDYFSVDVTVLPGGMNAEALLRHIRTNINDFIDTNISRFNYYPGLSGEEALWLSNNPLGALFSIYIPVTEFNIPFAGPVRDDGTVVTSLYGPSHWRFTTVWSPADGYHPVSGTREFGFTTNGDGTFTFYTRGVDRVTTLDVAAIQSTANQFGFDPAFDNADVLWSSFLSKVDSFVDSGGGAAVVRGNTGHRVDWTKLGGVMTGAVDASDYTGCTN